MNQLVASVGLFDIFSRFANILKVRNEANRAYKLTVKELSMLSDRELADIGLHRGMISTVANEVRQEAIVNANLKGWV